MRNTTPTSAFAPSITRRGTQPNAIAVPRADSLHNPPRPLKVLNEPPEHAPRHRDNLHALQHHSLRATTPAGTPQREDIAHDKECADVPRDGNTEPMCLRGGKGPSRFRDAEHKNDHFHLIPLCRIVWASLANQNMSYMRPWLTLTR